MGLTSAYRSGTSAGSPPRKAWVAPLPRTSSRRPPQIEDAGLGDDAGDGDGRIGARRRPRREVAAGRVADADDPRQVERRVDIGQRVDGRADVVERRRVPAAVADAPVLDVPGRPSPWRQRRRQRSTERQVVAGPPEPAVDHDGHRRRRRGIEGQRQLGELELVGAVAHLRARHQSPADGAPDDPAYHRTAWPLAADAFQRLDAIPRSQLATLPTPLERGPGLPGGARLWVKRDDLTGLGAGGNKARKLEFLCAEALRAGARSLVTVGAAQSNHCRMTAAAGAVLGLEVHLVLSGDRPPRPTGNQLLAEMFGAQLHFVGCPPQHWGELEIAREKLTDELAAQGAAPHSIPIGGSTPTGALGYLAAYFELVEQCRAAGMAPAAVVHTSSSGGTHAGLVAGRALLRALGQTTCRTCWRSAWPRASTPAVPDVRALAGEVLAAVDADPALVTADDVEIDARWMGPDYGVSTAAGDEAIRWGAVHGGWVLDRTYSGKGFAGLLGNAATGRWRPGTDVVFLHTGGLPAVFAD